MKYRFKKNHITFSICNFRFVIEEKRSIQFLQ
jgi:hypothetical protein